MTAEQPKTVIEKMKQASIPVTNHALHERWIRCEKAEQILSECREQINQLERHGTVNFTGLVAIRDVLAILGEPKKP